MKKKILSCALIFCLIIPCVLMLSACAYEHTFAETWSFNETHHWHESTCEHSEEIADYAEHIDENNDDVCDVCKYGQVALVGEVGYSTLESAVAVAEANDVITLTSDIDLQTKITINKKVTIDLNNKNLTVTHDTVGDGVFMIVEGGDLTINGNGEVNGVGDNDWNIVIFANGGNVTINGGTYTNIGATDTTIGDVNHFDVIYVKNGGNATINGGTFMGQTPKWILNSHDTLVGTIEVNGGTFIGFDPSNANTEPGGVTNFVSEGYKVQQSGYVYEVVEKDPIAVIAGVEYTTLQAAIDAVENGTTIVLMDNIETNVGFVVEKEITINLNGKNIVSTSLVKDLALFKVNNGGHLIINGEGVINSASQSNDYSIAIWARNGGKVTINGGTFTNVGGDSWDDALNCGNNNELIYASNTLKDGETYSVITINGGTFIGNYENATWGTRYTLNMKDNSQCKIEVSGGEFYRFNPSASLSEYPQANFVVDGFIVQQNGNYYTVVAE